MLSFRLGDHDVVPHHTGQSARLACGFPHLRPAPSGWDRLAATPAERQTGSPPILPRLTRLPRSAAMFPRFAALSAALVLSMLAFPALAQDEDLAFTTAA